jgi:hypothetical protein
MESIFKEDQGELLKAIQNGVRTEKFTLQDRREVLVCNGKVVETAQPLTRAPLSWIDVETLGSLTAIVKLKAVPLILRVESPSIVRLVDVSESILHQELAAAKAKVYWAAMLEGYVSLEQALVEIRECFEPSPMIEQLSDTLRTTKIEDITELSDSGLGMNVSVKSRVSNGKNGDATAFDLQLTPIRTFSEVKAIPGTFTMRWKREGAEIKVRLIEQSHPRWRLLQMQEIKSFLEIQLPEAIILM